MRHRITRAVALLTAPVVLATVVATAHAATAATPVHYRVTMIKAGTAFGNVPYALNAAGHTAGEGTFPGGAGDTGYVSTSPTQLAPLPGLVSTDPTLATATLAYGINSTDTVVGYAYQTLPIRQTAVVWRNGVPTDLDILPADGLVEARGSTTPARSPEPVSTPVRPGSTRTAGPRSCRRCPVARPRRRSASPPTARSSACPRPRPTPARRRPRSGAPARPGTSVHCPAARGPRRTR
ncbi:hypothetical protein GCM10029964_079780 [Kibdelosporangium lantanae]